MAADAKESYVYEEEEFSKGLWTDSERLIRGHPESEFKVKGRDKLHDVIRIGMAWNWGRAD
jgi:hypothetical protein